jgi:glutamate synthase domain-containing protein 2
MLIVEGLAFAFVLLLTLAVLTVIAMYVIDVNQTRSAVRRNYPVIGRLRYVLESLGEFLRQYFFAMDREELPFNRAQRSWIYQAAKGADTTQAFGSTRDLQRPGSVLFVNDAFPVLDEDAATPGPVTIGPGAARPYRTAAFFHISAMSYGAISRPAVLALANGARAAGIWLNTGEGGLSPWHLEGGADLVFQIGTARYGVRDANGHLDDARLREVAAHPQVKMIEIKLSQGAKPGKGGILPAAKVTAEIARIRGIPEGQASLSPNRHPDVADPAALLAMIERVRRVSGLPTGIKFVLGSDAWLDALFAAIAARGADSAPDFITLDSKDGGSGAAPMSLMDFMGMPLRESLPLLVDKLDAAGLRQRIRVVASGKLVNPGEVAWALCAGADFVASARGFMFALGCIQALQCNRNTCPTGITTHDLRRQRGLDPVDKAERVRRFAETMQQEVGTIAHSCGLSDPRLLTRSHCRVVTENGRSRLLSDLWPEPTDTQVSSAAFSRHG